MATLNDPNNPFCRLTAASTLRGSIVFNIALEELGRIEDVIIEERTGRIAFAIVHRGGFLGIGAHHYPLQWERLRFDVEMDGYIVDADRNVQERELSYTGPGTTPWRR
jgi:sporulation protein YlmC with PRC-barrel domain